MLQTLEDISSTLMQAFNLSSDNNSNPAAATKFLLEQGAELNIVQIFVFVARKHSSVDQGGWENHNY